MKYRLRIRRMAERELVRLHDWYELQSVGLGDRLLNELEKTYSALEATPFIYADIHRGIRRAILRRYPVGVFYKVVDGIVHVIAIRHLASNPAIWKMRR